jgi:hypothetical protein
MTDELLIEDKEIKITNTFKEYLTLNESFHNFLPQHEDKKKEHAKEVFDMIHKSYESQGGIHGSGFKSPEDMVKNIPMWKVHKKDGKIHAVALYKDKAGHKRVALGTDGSDTGKSAASNIVTSDLKQKRAHMEVSGKSLSFLKKHTNLKEHLHSFESAKKFHENNGDKIEKPEHDDPEVVRHPELKDHMYTRDIGGQKHTKVMLGYLHKNIT